MKTVEEHKLTQEQVTLMRDLLVQYINEATEDAPRSQSVYDLDETLDNSIHGGEQVVLVRYESGRYVQ